MDMKLLIVMVSPLPKTASQGLEWFDTRAFIVMANSVEMQLQ